MNATKIYRELHTYCNARAAEFNEIDKHRREKLQELADYIGEKLKAEDPVRIVVICTHNSRRSHMGQLWLRAAAAWYGLDDQIYSYSGGTEATSIYPRALEVMERAGFEIARTQEGKNPVYEARVGPGKKSTKLFSKTYDDPYNPKSDFAALMVCSEADENCPFVPGAEARFSLPFRDPKDFDDTIEEMPRYEETCRKMARQFLFTLSEAAKTADRAG
ncbi:MAG: protein-tyrosine-phosphatase [Saprospiraceae bacterium]|nr:protein-tyrosine-phosphatase [Saprospiraceae bacterium]